ncbi:hypothetical protein DH2020_007468 [Rehmannia glutinosa]|uniref:RNase H type-1 domain-containing protein n=1 Tax=Rehmannia glutinosa TaxID=99300 RepID=A0ABR0TYM3_REHGL
MQNDRGNMDDWVDKMRTKGDAGGQRLFAMLMWSLGDSHNKLIFNNVMVDHKSSFELAVERLREFTQQNSSLPLMQAQRWQEKWSPPEFGTTKINSASITTGMGMGSGVVVRDHRGQIIKTLTKFVEAKYDVNVAEALACREGILLAKEPHLTKIVLEIDNLMMFHRLARKADDLSYFGNVVLHYILDNFCFFSLVSPSFVKQPGNTLAHNCSCFAFTLHCAKPLVGDIPDSLVDLANSEMISQ